MEKGLAALISPIPAAKRAGARVALAGLQDSARHILADCFQHFEIETVAMAAEASQRLKQEKFEACVVALGPSAESVMASARSSASNSRMVLYALGGSARQCMSYSKYGINAIFQEPLDRSTALKLVRATQTLVLHEFRRYVRIPVITEVVVAGPGNHRFTATSQEISSGGMSLHSSESPSRGQPVEISFALLTLPRIWVRAAITWRREKDQLFGIRFDPEDERRLRIKDWIDAYLED